MNHKTLLKDHEWKEEEAIASILMLDMFRTSHVEGNRVYDGDLIEDAIFVMHDGYAYEWTRKDQVEAMQEWVWDTFRNDRPSLETKFQEYQAVLEEARDIYLQHFGNIDEYSNEKCAEIVSKMDTMVSDLYSYAMIPEGLDLLTGDDWEKHLPNVPEEKRPEVIQQLSSFDELSFGERYKMRLLNLAHEYDLAGMETEAIKQQKQDDEKLNDAIAEIVREYAWTKSSFEWWQGFTAEDVCEEMAEHVSNALSKDIEGGLEELETKKQRHKKMREEIYEQFDISEESKEFFAMVRFLSLIQDMRKEGVVRTVTLVSQIAERAKEEFNIPHEKMRKYYAPELVSLLKDGKKADVSDKTYVGYYDFFADGEVQLERIEGEKAEEMWNIIKATHEQETEDTLEGFVASTGDQDTVRGTVHIVFDPNADHGLEDGEILVTGMTRPEFVPLMKKAKGIVTNEGGITTHAAIVSRELGKPCIIGTQHATEQLQDGDEVELDLQNGRIKKIDN
jgi:phosphohistidine swiveling domain-containing protein